MTDRTSALYSEVEYQFPKPSPAWGGGSDVGSDDKETLMSGNANLDEGWRPMPKGTDPESARKMHDEHIGRNLVRMIQSAGLDDAEIEEVANKYQGWGIAGSPTFSKFYHGKRSSKIEDQNQKIQDEIKSLLYDVGSGWQNPSVAIERLRYLQGLLTPGSNARGRSAMERMNTPENREAVLKVIDRNEAALGDYAEDMRAQAMMDPVGVMQRLNAAGYKIHTEEMSRSSKIKTQQELEEAMRAGKIKTLQELEQLKAEIELEAAKKSEEELRGPRSATAAAVETAKTGAEIGLAGAKESAKQGAEKKAQLAVSWKSVKPFIDAWTNLPAEGAIVGGFNKYVGLPVSRAFNTSDPEVETAIANVKAKMVDIVRGLGQKGVLSDFDTRMALQAMPDMTDSKSQRAAKLSTLKEIFSNNGIDVEAPLPSGIAGQSKAPSAPETGAKWVQGDDGIWRQK
jgi:hypothetical protein